jgi:putative DNA primase/helicase
VDDTFRYFTACFGDNIGWLITAVGENPSLEGGKYHHGKWSEHAWRWPAHADHAVHAVLEASATADVYACPYLMRSRARTKGNAGAHILVHADVDGQLDLAVVEDLGGFAVSSGTPGHAHVYIPLTYAVTAAQHELLCRGLAGRLGGDAKISDNDLLRPPGTLNHKPTVAGGSPTSVRLVAL